MSDPVKEFWITVKTDLAWLAGLFDGEGCISFNNGKDRPYAVKLRIVLESRDKFVLEKCQEITDAGTLRHRPVQKSWKPNCSDQWEWCVGKSADVYLLLRLLEPYLVLKKERAQLAIKQLEEHSTKVQKVMARI